MLKLRMAPQANQGLIDIGEYTQMEWGYGQRERYIKQLFDRINWLTENPHLGKARPEIEHGDYSYHEGKHKIFYYYYDKSLTIIGVLHESMDFERHLLTILKPFDRDSVTAQLLLCTSPESVYLNLFSQ